MSNTVITFTMRDLEGVVVPNTLFQIVSGRPNTGVIPTEIPVRIEFETDENGEATVTLVSSEVVPYFISKVDGSTESVISYKFFVPQSEFPLASEMLYVDLGPRMRQYNDKSIAALIEAKVVAVNAKNQVQLYLASHATIHASIAAMQAEVKASSDAYLGSKSTPPTVRKDGSPLVPGDQYYSTASNGVFIWNSLTWIPFGSGGSAEYSTHTATAGQAVFTVPTQPASNNAVDVFINGITQARTTFTVSSTTVTLSTGTNAGDTVEVRVATLSTAGAVAKHSEELVAVLNQTNYTTTKPMDALGSSVFLDGAYQHRSTYNIVGENSLQFSEAPPAGTKIEIVTVGSTSYTGGVDLLKTQLAASNGASLIGFQPSGVGAVATTVQEELRKRKSVFGTGVAATDTANLQNAVNDAEDYQEIELFGAFALNAKITVKPKLTLLGNYATIAYTNSTQNLFDYSPGTPSGYPGRIIFDRLNITGPGNTGTCVAINIDANAPFVQIKDCAIAGFFKGIYLRDCYCSNISDNSLSTMSHGIQLYRESHATNLINNFVDACSVTALSVNYGGGAGTGPTHNINVIGGAYQNSGVGVWVEQVLGLHTVGLYHEGNTVNDYRIGVADAGSYARAVYNTVIDGFESSSACVSGKNILIEHSVGVDIRAAAWNAGCSTSATLLSFDGYADRVTVDIQRHTTASPSPTAPVDFTVAPTRGVLKYKGRPIYASGQQDAIQFGTLATQLSAIYQGHTPGGREALSLISFLKDLQIRAPELIRMQDAAGNDLIQVDALNGKVVVLKPLQVTGQTVGTVVGAAGGANALPAAPLGYWNTSINGVSVRIPYYN